MQGGYIDNRLKTLLDTLTMPSKPDRLPTSAEPSRAETLMFCILEDDNLINQPIY